MSAELEKFPGTADFEALPQTLRERLAAVKLLILDVDGVLTDGGLYYGADGTVAKRFNVHDGLGIGLAKRNGLHIAVITGQDQPAVHERMKVLGIDDYFAGYMSKRKSYEILREKYGLSSEQVAFLGDDWIDLPVMTVIGAPLAVANAQPEVKAAAIYVTRATGGNGAVREVIRLILHSKGQLEHIFAAWMEKHST